MSTTLGTVVTLDADILSEDTDGQYVEVDLTDGNGVPINTAAIDGIVGTLRSLDTQGALFDDVDLMAAPARASFPGAPGRVRVTFTAADMKSVLLSNRPQRFQTRRLTLAITHSGDRLFHCSVLFRLYNMGDV